MIVYSVDDLRGRADDPLAQWAAEELERLQTLVDAQRELIWAYEDELEPDNYDEDDLPEAIAKARRAVDLAEAGNQDSKEGERDV